MKKNSLNSRPLSSTFLNGFILGCISGFSLYYFLKVPQGQQSAQRALRKVKKAIKDTQKELKRKDVSQKIEQVTNKIKKNLPETEQKIENFLTQTKDFLNSEIASVDTKSSHQNSTQIVDHIQADLEKKASSLEKNFFTQKGRKVKK